MEPTITGARRWVATVISTLTDALNSHWVIFTSRYPGLLERCIIAIGVVYIISIGWPLVRISAKAGFASLRWGISRIYRTLRLASQPTFKDLGSAERVVDKELYGLEHMALNWTWEGGLRTMWMNMGYWKNTDSFPQASENLLKYLLEKAGIIAPLDLNLGPYAQHRVISILDLGFGCGDQTLYLTSQLPENIHVTSYVGITLSKVQCEFAKKRVLNKLAVMDILLDRPQDTPNGRHSDLDGGFNIETERLSPSLPDSSKRNISLYTADASNPASWPSSLQHTLLPTLSPPTSPLSQAPPQKASKTVPHYGKPDDQDEPHMHWTLGLDSLYHFRPSRVPILNYTHDKLQSNLIAFDLLRSSTRISVIQSLFLRAFCIAASIPYHNLLTKEEYIRMLVTEVGYHKDEIIIEDISEFVFPGLAHFILRRTREMEKVGIKWKRWAGYKVVAWVVRTGLLRGAVVVARWGKRKLKTGGNV